MISTYGQNEGESFQSIEWVVLYHQHREHSIRYKLMKIYVATRKYWRHPILLSSHRSKNSSLQATDQNLGLHVHELWSVFVCNNSSLGGALKQPQYWGYPKAGQVHEMSQGSHPYLESISKLDLLYYSAFTNLETYQHELWNKIWGFICMCFGEIWIATMQA